jgi:endonuclease/exonuclease/phosphatase (EEP) superfamily protein YafD
MALILGVLVWVCRAAAAVIALACAVLAVAGQWGRWSPRLDNLNHAAPFWLLGAFAAAGLWAAAGRSERVTPVLALVAVVASAWLIAPEIAGAIHFGPGRPSREVLKVIQFNVWADNIDPAGTARWIASQDADVVVLEEATPPIAEALQARYPYATVCNRHDYCSTMILSRRRPIAEAAHGSLSQGWATYPGAGGPFTVVGAHVSWPWPPGAQAAQSRVLALMLAHLPKARMIVAGDFNSTPWTFALRRQDRAFGLERRTRALFSWPAVNTFDWRKPSPLPLLPIDHVYAGPGWRTVSVRRGPKLGSDHYPVVVTLTASP